MNFNVLKLTSSPLTIVFFFTAWIVLMLEPTPAVAQTGDARAQGRPNILWLTAEDIGPQLGCYGDSVAKTPNLDAMAARGMVFDVAWSNYPVCAPARTTIITGMYAAANGAGHMRCLRPLPDGVEMFPEILRQAGYFCTNRTKEDYNHPKSGKVWDQSNRKAHFNNRPKGTGSRPPFFSVFNQTVTHESRIRKRPHQAVTDPQSVRLASYWPDRPEVRQDWAQYYDNITKMDDWVGVQLNQLEQSGVADNTIVIFYGDHGSGMPRHKRYAGDSGMRVPFIVYFPEKYQHLAPAGYAAGKHSKELVSFVDLAPTTLSLAGIEPPQYMQGRAFAGAYRALPAAFLYGFRERMDERPDLSRSLRDDRFLYIRNYMPHLSAGQHINYQMQTPTTRLWRELYDAGKLTKVQRQFWEARPAEEFYDLQKDPEETVNLIDNKNYQKEIRRFQEAHRRKTMEIRDPAFIPETMLHRIASQPTGVAGFCSDSKKYPLQKIFDVASQAAQTSGPIPPALLQLAQSENSILRYWLAMAFVSRGSEACQKHVTLLKELMRDPVPAVAVAAAEALAVHGPRGSVKQAVNFLVSKANVGQADFYVAVAALNALDHLPLAAQVPAGVLNQFPRQTDQIQRGDDYVQRLIEKVLAKIQAGQQ